MGNIFVFFDMGVPQIGCTDCSHCKSIMGKSLCSIINRGCCHYFPEFTLVDIQRMAALEGGRRALDMILSYPGTKVNRFNLYSTGHFDKDAYEKYMASGALIETGGIKDHTIFFRTCPFVVPEKGCMLPARFRTTVCNFFICSEIIDDIDDPKILEEYMKERSRYARWVYRESGILQHLLEERGLDLISDFTGAVRMLAEMYEDGYDFPILEPAAFGSATGTK
ncbi:MAG: hypothetical protein GX279_07180 [Clostridiaceae bacterium]|nr:hypothetical protein [Clostridiaceae bacterium]